MERLNQCTCVAAGNEVYLFANQANAELDSLKRHYQELLDRYIELSHRYDSMLTIYINLVVQYNNLEIALNRALEVLKAGACHGLA